MADYDPDTTQLWIGGTTTNALQFNQGTYITRSTAAIILQTSDVLGTVERGYLIDHMTHPINGELVITGVRALFAFESEAFGIFEADGQNLICLFSLD